ncbi:acyltransferase family protein [Hafnia alvei]|uniref:Acyltransferase n=1 Tax=Hafnia alvei TaxID=569 RepID=A0ABD7PYJ2_HAFAL|nr:acyltransferase [Hafnia alvei]TBL64746.1 acyltransferase [Hafnia alvei]
MNKITHLEGLRGLCCFIVVFDHCVSAFNSALRHTNISGLIGDMQRVIAWSPLNLIYSGIPSVYIFFILSGFVLSNKFNLHKKNDILISASIKRYPRLILPIFFAMVVMFIIYIISNSIFGTNYNLSIIDVFMQSFIYVPFGGSKLENGAMWTITYELYGSFLIFATLALFGSYKYKYGIYFILFLFTLESYYCVFIFGMVINSLLHDGYSCKIKNKYIALFIIAISLVLISYPYPRSSVSIGGVYSYLSIFKDQNTTYQYLTKFGCITLFVSLFSLDSIKSFFNNPTLQFMGKISFSVYILHVPFLIFALNFKNEFHSTPIKLLALTFIVYLLTIITSIYFENFIDTGAVKYSNKLAKRVA